MGSEVFVNRLPRSAFEDQLVPLFSKCGQIYEMRLMMDYNNMNRRYCYVRYTTEDAANCAIELLNHHFVENGQTLDVQKSYEKNRLFVGNLPRDIDRETLEEAFRQLFPELNKFVMHNRICDGNKNRGFAFLDFGNHETALRAKQQTTPGYMRMWDRDIKIVWAYPERSHSSDMSPKDVKTLFIRNVHMTVTNKDMNELFAGVVDHHEIVKISRVRELAFVEFHSRDAAKTVMEQLQAYEMNGYKLDIEFAMPPISNSVKSMRNYDFDVLLRMKCLANSWDPPITVYGRIFVNCFIQYVAVTMRSGDFATVYFLEVCTHNLVDIQSRVSEVLIKVISENGWLHDEHLVIKVEEDSFTICKYILIYRGALQF
jgi:heterogeneous nuclear ribonucleoprotein R